MPGHGVPIGMPMDQKLGTTSSMATMASSMATSTRWPRPVRSRWRSADSVPITANRAVAMSPSPPIGEPTGAWPAGRLNSYAPLMASTMEASAGQPS